MNEWKTKMHTFHWLWTLITLPHSVINEIKQKTEDTISSTWTPTPPFRPNYSNKHVLVNYN